MAKYSDDSYDSQVLEDSVLQVNMNRLLLHTFRSCKFCVSYGL